MRRWPEEESGISLNSLIDVLFILLLFLMISLNLKPENYLDLQLPDVDAPEQEGGKNPSLLIELSAGKEVFLKGAGLDERFFLATLPEHRKQLSERCSKEKRILLRVDRKVIYEDLVQLLEALRACEGADLAVQKAY